MDEIDKTDQILPCDLQFQRPIFRQRDSWCKLYQVEYKFPCKNLFLGPMFLRSNPNCQSQPENRTDLDEIFFCYSGLHITFLSQQTFCCIRGFPNELQDDEKTYPISYQKQSRLDIAVILLIHICSTKIVKNPMIFTGKFVYISYFDILTIFLGSFKFIVRKPKTDWREKSYFLQRGQLFYADSIGCFAWEIRVKQLTPL